LGKLVVFRIEKRGSKWVVLPESGDKVLGEHDTKEEAEAQLRAIEAHKNMGFAPSGEGGLHDASAEDERKPRMSRVFSVNAWRFSISIGKWDRFTSWGTKIKDGAESVFDEKNLGQILENFSKRKNDIAMCYDHQSAYVAENGQPAPALAFYNALALVVDGKVAKFATHDPSVSPPDPTGLENGIYGYRNELTPLGEKLLPNYKYLSPMFTNEGADEAGNSIGYDLIDVAATNTPFQDAVGLTFHRMGYEPSKQGTNAQEYSLDPELLKKLGLADGASADEMKGAMAKYMTDAEDKAKAFADLEEKMKKFEEDKKAAEAEKMAQDADAQKMDKADGDGDEDKDAKEKMAKDLGLAPGASLAKIHAALSAKMVPMSKLAETEKRLAALEEERKAEKQSVLEKQYAELADKGIASGYSKEKREDLIKFARADFDAAKSFVESLPGSKVFTRFTNGGNPLNTERSDGNAKTGKINGVEVPVHGATFAEKAKAYAKEHKCDLAKAQREVLKSDPAALADYIGQ